MNVLRKYKPPVKSRRVVLRQVVVNWKYVSDVGNEKGTLGVRRLSRGLSRVPHKLNSASRVSERMNPTSKKIYAALRGAGQKEEGQRH